MPANFEGIPRVVSEVWKRTQELKWQELEKRGYSKPKDEEERRKRLKEAHGE